MDKRKRKENLECEERTEKTKKDKVCVKVREESVERKVERKGGKWRKKLKEKK